MKRAFLIFVAVLSAATAVCGQEAAVPDKSSSLTLLQTVIPRDPAALGMGATSALEAVSIANSALFNPGVIPFSSVQTDFSASYQMWQPDVPSSSGNVNVGFAYNHVNKFGVSISFASDRLSGYDVADDNGVIRSQYSPSNLLAALGIAFRFIPELAFSVTARYLYSNIFDDVSYGSPSFDAGLTFGKGAFMAAAGISNAAPAVEGKYPLPASVYVSGSYLAVWDKSELELRAQSDIFLYGAVRAAAGASWTYGPVVARLGYNFGGKSPIGSFFSMGMGLSTGYVHADLALLLGDGPMNKTLCAGVGFSF